MSQPMPWYPLYHADFAIDTQAWTAEEVGCLIRLMNYQWANGSVPVSHLLLARICSVEPDIFRKIWVTLKPKFDPVASAPGHLLNRRLAIEHQRQTAKREKARNAVNKRWENERIKKGLDTDVHTPAIPSSESESESDLFQEGKPQYPPELNAEAWEEWIAFRRLKKWGKYADVTVRKWIKKLSQFSHIEQRAIIDYSLNNEYKGLFPDKRGGSNEPGLSPTERVERATGIKRL